jgi:hypothetical protein
MAHNKNIKGIAGEMFVKKYCKEQGISYDVTDEKENIVEGIDCYMDSTPTDVKNTKALYFLNIDAYGSCQVRHPFRENSKATHYCFVDVNNKSEGKFESFLPIRSFLLKEYFKTSRGLISFIKTLQGFNEKKVKDFGGTLEQAAFLIKKELSVFLKTGVYIYYSFSSDEKTQLASFKILKKEASPKKEALAKFLEKHKKQKKVIRKVIEVNL